MTVKRLNPVTPSSRFTVLISRDGLWKGRPEKTLVRGKMSTGGRNVHGRITVRHKGGGHKKLYRFVDFKRRNLVDDLSGSGEVERIEYDPNRSAFIALVRSAADKNVLFYILAPEGLKAGDILHSGLGASIDSGNAMQLTDVPIGSSVHSVELKSRKGGQMVRSAGCSAHVVAKESGKVLLRLPSGVMKAVSGSCYASIGVVSNSDHKNTSLGKAGRNRWKGVRPSVRGVAMNPVDHPHGGGEGKSSGGRHPVTPWGVPTKGKRTVKRSSKKGNLFR